MTPLDPKHIAALQAHRAALAGLVAAGLPANPAITAYAQEAYAGLVVLYEKLLGLPVGK